MALIHELLPKVADEIGAIAKNRKNQQQNYSFRGIDDVLNASHAALIRNGICVATRAFDVKREERQGKSGGLLIYTTLMLETTFYAKDGSNVVTTTVGEAMDSGDKSSNKAMSAALKYAFFQTFTIPLEEPETENDSPEPAPRKPQPKPAAKPDPAKPQKSPAVKSLDACLSACGCKTPEDADLVVRFWTDGMIATVAEARKDDDTANSVKHQIESRIEHRGIAAAAALNTAKNETVPI